MIKKKIRLIFFINTYSDYLNDFISTIVSFFEIKVILTNLNSRNTSYNKIIDKKIYQIRKNYDVNKELTNYKPDFIFIGGYKHKLSNQLIKICHKKNIKYLFWLERVNFNFYLKFFLFKIFFKKRLKKSDGILAIGNQAFKFYKKFQVNTFLLPYNINIKKFKERKPNKKIKLLYVGQFIYRKGIDLILESFNFLDRKILENIECTFVGNGPLRKKIIDKTKKYNFIKLVNFKSRKDLIEIYSHNDILLFPSKYDGWGVVPMEAMSSKMSLIISKKCGISEYLYNKKNGLIIEPNSKDISKAITYYFNNQSKINNHGSNNLNLMKKSLLNSENSGKFFLSIINKFNTESKKNYKIDNN